MEPWLVNALESFRYSLTECEPRLSGPQREYLLGEVWALTLAVAMATQRKDV